MIPYLVEAGCLFVAYKLWTWGHNARHVIRRK